MIKTKLWVFCALVVVLGGVNFSYTAKQQHQYLIERSEDWLNWGESKLVELQKVEHEAALEQVKAVAGLPAVQRAVAQANRAGSAPGAEALQELVESVWTEDGGEAQPSQVFVATPHGARILEAGKIGESVSPPEVPGLQSALDGANQAGIQVWDGELVRVAAATVEVRRGNGAVLLRFPVDDAYAGKMAETLGMQVSITSAARAVASSLSPALAAELARANSQASAGETFSFGERDDLVTDITSRLLNLESAAGYGRAVSIPGSETAMAVISVAPSEQLASMERYQTRHALALAGLVVLSLVWGFYLSWSAGRPARRMGVQVGRVANGDLQARLEPQEFRGDFRRLAELVNGAIDQSSRARSLRPHGASRREKSDISNILETDARASSAESPAVAAPKKTAFTESEPDAGNPPFDDAPPVAAFAEPDVGLAAEPAAKEEPPAMMEPEAEGVTAVDGRASVHGAIRDEEALEPQSPSSDPFSAVLPPAGLDGEEEPPSDATVVARVPEALLQATARATRGGSAAAGPPRDPDDAHFREVFEAFLETREECGEPTESLTFEKFVVKLRKNRDAIKEKHGVRSVRFQVRVKEGRAALKATPIR